MQIFIQIMILTTSCSSIWLIQRTEKWARWGFVIGLLGVPFWLISTIPANQWGMVIVSVWFGYCNILGVKRRFKANDGK